MEKQHDHYTRIACIVLMYVAIYCTSSGHLIKVGGEFFEVVLSNMNEFGRVSICGAISLYNETEKPKCEWY